MLHVLVLALLALGWPIQQATANQTKPVHEYAIDLYGASEVRTAARTWMKQRGKSDVVPALIRTLRYFPEDSRQTLHLLKLLTGKELGPRWFDWFVWLEQSSIQSFPNNEIFLEQVFSRIDPQFKIFFYPGIERRIRLDEITWGGVRKDGIPALTNPELVAAERADYLRDKDLVFGISINNDVRAYPLRIMDWHEMLNDTIGGVPVSLAYCTLCGSGILYKTARSNEKSPYIFGSSGFLYRSNKLMYDQETHSLWNQFSGKPVVGPLADTELELEVLPLVVTSWKKWRDQHPGTKVLNINTGYNRDYTPGTAYGAYFNSDDLMFPAYVSDRSLQQKEKVFGLRLSGSQKAWPLKLFTQPRAINDQIGVIPIVLIGDAKSSSVRAYRSNGKLFSLDQNNHLIADNKTWNITEAELIGPQGETLGRLPGHIAYWFAWSGYYPKSLTADPESN